MKNLKTFESFSVFKLSLLNELTLQARNMINDEHNLNGSFSDYCDLGCEVLSKLLDEHDIPHNIIQGEVYHQYEDSEPDHYGHEWISVYNDDMEYILDPTVEQFDSTKYVISENDIEYDKYEY